MEKSKLYNDLADMLEEQARMLSKFNNLLDVVERRVRG